MRKGKKRPFAKLEKSKDTQRVFASLGSEKGVTATNRKSLQTFTASMYGAKQKESWMPLNKYRHKVFQKAYGPKATAKNPLEKLKGLDSSGLPPCESELTTHVNRSAFIATMWVNADQKEVDQHPKQHDGWELEDDTYNIVWFEGQQLPDTLVPKVTQVPMLGTLMRTLFYLQTTKQGILVQTRILSKILSKCSGHSYRYSYRRGTR